MNAYTGNNSQLIIDRDVNNSKSWNGFALLSRGDEEVATVREGPTGQRHGGNGLAAFPRRQVRSAADSAR